MGAGNWQIHRILEREVALAAIIYSGNKGVSNIIFSVCGEGGGLGYDDNNVSSLVVMHVTRGSLYVKSDCVVTKLRMYMNGY